MVSQYGCNWYTSALFQGTRPQHLRHSRSSHCRTSSSPSEIFTVGNVIKVTAVLIVAAATIITFPAPTN